MRQYMDNEYLCHGVNFIGYAFHALVQHKKYILLFMNEILEDTTNDNNKAYHWTSLLVLDKMDTCH